MAVRLAGLVVVLFAALAGLFMRQEPDDLSKQPGQDAAVEAIWAHYGATGDKPTVEWVTGLNCRAGASAEAADAVGWFETIDGHQTCVAGLAVFHRHRVLVALVPGASICESALAHELLHMSDWNRTGRVLTPLHQPEWLKQVEEAKVACSAADR